MSVSVCFSGARPRRHSICHRFHHTQRYPRLPFSNLLHRFRCMLRHVPHCHHLDYHPLCCTFSSVTFSNDLEQLLIKFSSMICPAIPVSLQTLPPSFMIPVFFSRIAARLSSSVLEVALICNSSFHTSFEFS